MKLERRTDIQAYYDLGNCCDNDLAFICKLLQFVEHRPKSAITQDLEYLRVARYEDNFNYLLDNLKTGTIKNLYEIYKARQEVTNGNEC